MNPIDITGQKYHRLTAIKRAGKKQNKNGTFRYLWLCRCECGNTVVVCTGTLRYGNTKSCGCYKRDKTVERMKKKWTTHGASFTKEYEVWHCIKQRCFNQNHKAYSSYGGRGITMCRKWRDSFEEFHKDMGNVPRGKTIGRIDNNGDYEPGNCRWEDKVQQAVNRRTTRFYEKDGRVQPMLHWSRELGISYSTLQYRLSKDPNYISKC